MDIYFCNAGHRNQSIDSVYDPPEPEWLSAFVYANTRSQARWHFAKEFDLAYTDPMQILKVGSEKCSQLTIIINLPSEAPLWKLVPWKKIKSP